MRIITLKEDEFNNYAKKHKYESYCQNSLFAQFKNKQEKFDIHYLGFEVDGNLVGATMVIYKTLFLGYKFAYAPRGFLLDYADNELIRELSTKLINLLKKQKFIFMKIDPPVILNERNFSGKIIYHSEVADQILNTLKNNNYQHLGFNLYNESILPRYNAFAKILPNHQNMFKNFSNQMQEKIKDSCRMAVDVFIDKNNNIEELYNFIKPSYGKRGKLYVKNFIETFNQQGNIKIFYAIINTNAYAKNTNQLYNVESEKNIGLIKIIESGDPKYDIEKVINDKIESDKLLSKYKKDIVASTDFLRKFPEGVLCSATVVVEHNKGVDVLFSHSLKQYQNFYANEAVIYEIMKYYSNRKFKYINLGAVYGNFNSKSKYYPLLKSKEGFNSSVIEYIGEFDLVINKLLYKIYKKKYKDQKLTQ